MSGYYYGYPRQPSESFWDRLHPSIKSAALIWLGVLVLQIINVVTVGVSLVIAYPLQLLIYVGNGALAAYIADGDEYPEDEFVRIGAGAGVALSALTWVVYVVLIFVLGVATLGVGWTGLLSCIICGPIDLLVAVLCSALGAWIFQQFWV